jgi:septal ring-binding cell division protein DamX
MSDNRLPRQAPPARRSESSPGATSILQQPYAFYTVQLIALQDENSVLQYAQDTGLKYPLYAQIQSKGRTMYVLLLGCYPDRLSAVHAKEDWSRSKNLSVRPWVRQVGPLQDAIRLAVR